MLKLRTLITALILLMVGAAFAAEPADIDTAVDMHTAVDINTADAEALAIAIKGVGIKKAEAIVAHREKHGPFGSVDDLVEVSGIGPTIIEKNRENLTVGAMPSKDR